MVHKLPQRIGRKIGLDDYIGELDFQSLLGNAPANLVVVGQIIHQRFETADGLKIGLAEGERGTQSKMNAAFELRARPALQRKNPC